MEKCVKPKISVIIPVYNVAPYLEECLESTLTQSLSEIEVICINDGSTDHSLDILERYSELYSNLVLINQINQGTAKARNLGLETARGEFVAFMDPDDYYPQNDVLKCLYDAAEEHGVSIAGGSFSYYKNGIVIEEFDEVLSGHVFKADEVMKYQDYQFPYGFTRFIYNLEFIKRNNISFPLYVSHEDPPFMVEAMVHAGEFYAMKKITYQYRIGHKPAVLTAQKTMDCIRAAVDLLNISRKYGMGRLHAFAVRIIYYDVYLGIYKYLGEGHPGLPELLLSAEKLVEESLISDVNIARKNYPIIPSEVKKLREKMNNAEIEFRKLLENNEMIVIYGAGLIGKELASAIELMFGTTVNYFAVTDQTDNDDSIKGIPVKTISEISALQIAPLIFVATSEKYHAEIAEVLEEWQFEKVHFVNMRQVRFFNLIARKS